MGYGKAIEISVKGQKVVVRDYGRGIPLGKVLARSAVLFWCYYNEILLSKGEKSDEEGSKIKALEAIQYLDKFDRKKAASLKGLPNCKGLILNKN